MFHRRLYAALMNIVLVTGALGVGVGMSPLGHPLVAEAAAQETGWHIVPSSTPGTTDNQLSGVACASATLCFAVGNGINRSGYGEALIEQWNGAAWNAASSPNLPAIASSQLNAVTCVTASECFAVGDQYPGNAGAAEQTLIEEWNETSHRCNLSSQGLAGRFA